MISVVMSVYNEKIEWLEQAVNSILIQTYTDFEFIIICDNPNIEYKTREYLEQLDINNSKVKVLWNKKNMGLASSLNRGIECARGDYIARMDADDISDRERLQRELEFMIRCKYDMVSTNKINIDENGKIISIDSYIIKNPNELLMYGNMIIHSSVLVKRNVLNILGGYRKLVNSEDWDLWLRMIEQSYVIGILNEPLLLYRVRSNSASIGRQLQQFYISQYIIKMYKERIRLGYDSFSEKSMVDFLKNKKITKKKQEKFSKSYYHIQQALENRDNRRWMLCIIEIGKAGVLFPELAFRDLSNYVKIKIFYNMKKRLSRR